MQSALSRWLGELDDVIRRRKLEHRAGVEPAIRALQARALATWRPVLVRTAGQAVGRPRVFAAASRNWLRHGIAWSWPFGHLRPTAYWGRFCLAGLGRGR